MLYCPGNAYILLQYANHLHLGWKIEIDFSDPDTPMAEPKPPESESSGFRMVSYYYHHFMCIYILFTQTIASLFELTIMLFVTILLQHLYC